MILLSEAELTDRIIKWVSQNGLVAGSSVSEINAETDLLSSGLLDSFGLIDLILYLETESGHNIDLTDADPAELSFVNGLSRLALRSRH